MSSFESFASQQKHRVVIVGGGFAGLKLARSLKRAAVSVTLLDRRNFHLFQPLLYQVATGILSPANIATPLRSIVNRQKNVEVLLDDVVDFDVPNRKVICRRYLASRSVNASSSVLLECLKERGGSRLVS